MGALTGGKPPVPGACRVYPMVRIEAEDALAVAMKRFERRGWKALEEDYRILPAGTEYVQVQMWAIPPGWAEREAAREEAKRRRKEAKAS